MVHMRNMLLILTVSTTSLCIDLASILSASTSRSGISKRGPTIAIDSNTRPIVTTPIRRGTTQKIRRGESPPKADRGTQRGKQKSGPASRVGEIQSPLRARETGSGAISRRPSTQRSQRTRQGNSKKSPIQNPPNSRRSEFLDILIPQLERGMPGVGNIPYIRGGSAVSRPPENPKPKTPGNFSPDSQQRVSIVGGSTVSRPPNSPIRDKPPTSRPVVHVVGGTSVSRVTEPPTASTRLHVVRGQPVSRPPQSQTPRITGGNSVPRPSPFLGTRARDINRNPSRLFRDQIGPPDNTPKLVGGSPVAQPLRQFPPQPFSPGLSISRQPRIPVPQPNTAIGLGTNHRSVPKVLGGADVRDQGRPWHAQLFALRKGGFNCGGSLIDSCHILTAKHCIENQDKNTLWATLGEHNIKVVDGNEKNVTYAEYYIHPVIDIAVIRLEESVRFTNFIKPVSIRAGQFFAEPAIGSKPWVTGFGVVDPSTFETANILQEVQVEIVDKIRCKSRDNIDITDHEMCGGFEEATRYENVCYGDSGGPLVVQLSNLRWTQIGVVKSGIRHCPENVRYAIYTNISAAYDWILDLTADVYVNPNNRRCTKFAQSGSPRSAQVNARASRNQNTDPFNFQRTNSNTQPSFFGGIFNRRH